MGFSARSLLAITPFALALVCAPSIAVAQGGTATPPPPPPGGGAAAPAPAPAGSGTAAPAADEKKGEVGGFSFNDKPRRGTPQPQRHIVRRTGPLATFPGFEQLPDGGSRLFVQISQNVPVEERRAQGSVTYVLKGAHLRVHNDSNALVTVHFNTPVFRARLTPSGNDLLFVLELRSAATPAFKVQANQDKSSTLMIDFPKGDFVTDGDDRVPREERQAKPTKDPGKPAPPENKPNNAGPTP